MWPATIPHVIHYLCSGEERTKSSSLSYLNCLYQVKVTTITLAAIAVLGTFYISWKVKNILNICALGNPSVTAMSGCI